ncbi:hypothetical protein SEA_ALSABER_74 [Streptomyces phage Alsaber]|uniref:Uncharacterized protein n=1 Tax=Streptomyces phage Alsaber TaxID=2053672 RepID=A0A2H4PGM1_9CAUD|nr:hypothetical protein KGG97_gp74 [Streptomyces phage Alsaber]ATW61348.1 hypothetical protein SEA_ALSABER_74 [Streptomyces phage Alsaber]
MSESESTMKLRHKILSTVAILAVGYGVGVQNEEPAPKASPVKVETVATVAPKPKPTPLPARTEYVIVKVPTSGLPTKECAPDGGRNCYWDGGTAEVRGGYSYWVGRDGQVTYLVPRLNDIAKRKTWEAGQRKAGREFWDTYDGHRFCYAKVGDTSYVSCWDGYKTTT